MRTHEIISRFDDYFTRADHARVPSASLILDDPTLLFVAAGMVQFKPYFLGDSPAPFRRATSIQKCVRTGDIDEVGRTTRHNTFFQMAGNFSFGDYFKAEAIEYAWNLVTGSQDAGGYGLDPDRIWVTVYRTDEEAAELWRRIAGLPSDRIQRRGMADNFWSMGVPGPCGPSSEIYYDRGAAHGRDGGPEADEDRYLEIWNLVFMQDVRGEGGTKDNFPLVGALPNRNIDTGMGVERLAYLLQDVDNVYETDLVRPVIARAEELSGRRYGHSGPTGVEDDVRFRVIADHARSGVMIIGDGVTPSNEGRGYVLRRLLRRIVRSARLLGVHEPVLESFAEVVRDTMSRSYPELANDFGRISATLRAEEDAFLSTLTAGSRIFDLAVATARRAGGTQLPGDQAFQLHDTYGFPIDLTLEMASEAGLTVDEPGFRRLMAEQRNRARADAVARKTGHIDATAYRAALDAAGTTSFLGYSELSAECRIVGLIVDGVGMPAAGAGTAVEIVLDRTPFYAEGGGQQADTGVLRGDGFEITVSDVQTPISGLSVHRGVVAAGEVTIGALAYAIVDTSRRGAISRSHSATHLVHAGMRKHLGDAAAQAGSLNAPGRLRFDFTSPTGAVPESVLSEVEDEVNSVLADDHEVRSYITTQDEARRIGAMALFGEKYGDQVRVVEIGDYSRELCGGTHVDRSGQLGLVKLLSEASIGAGVRRVEALVGMDAFRFLAREHVLISQLSEQLKARPEELPERISGVVERLRQADRELDEMRVNALLSSAGELAETAADVNGTALVIATPQAIASGNDLRALAVAVRDRLENRPAVVAIFSSTGDRVAFVVATTGKARTSGISANKLVPVFAAAIDGRGGGKPDLAQGGGSNPSGVERATRSLYDHLAAKSG
ncbi:MAG: alanine--tRNA ligase [Actinobacteria bacterium]|nr:alanine--tRNA ligase [Actinomycetota bacterium]